MVASMATVAALALLLASIEHAKAFVTISKQSVLQLTLPAVCFDRRSDRLFTCTVLYRHIDVKRSAGWNSFKFLLDRAFENDSNLSQEDKQKGMLVGPDDDDYFDREDLGSSRNRQQLTAVQKKWRETTSGELTGASMARKMQQEILPGSAIDVTLYLTGVPDKDPSNDLYGSRENISSRDRQVGLALPEQPTAVQIEFLADSKCRVSGDSTPFTVPDKVGDWKISADGRQIRFRIQVAGFERRVETKGTIQKIFWSNEESTVMETMTSYRILPGWLYGEAILTPTREGSVEWHNGILKVEQSIGFLGVATKMVPCGKFTAKAMG